MFSFHNILWNYLIRPTVNLEPVLLGGNSKTVSLQLNVYILNIRNDIIQYVISKDTDTDGTGWTVTPAGPIVHLIFNTEVANFTFSIKHLQAFAFLILLF